jgi:ribosome maturation factor RimP
MTLPDKIETIVTPVLNRMGLDLVLGSFRRERSGKVLRLMVEKRGAAPERGSGVDVGLCATVSREVGTQLDVSDVIEGAYTLEVSSAGIERPLMSLGDFERFSGRRAKIRTDKVLSGSRNFDGTLSGVEDGTIILVTKNNQKISIPKNAIKRANLVFDYKR